MSIKDKITSAINKAKEATQKLTEKKMLTIKDIVLIPEFQKLLAMEESVLEKMKESMKNEGFKSGHEIHIWKRDKEYILIDGHTRKCAWESLGNKTIPCIVHHFATLEEAKTYAIQEQVNRRNLSGQALLEAVANFNFEKGKGNGINFEEKGKASEIIAKQIGVSSKTVEKTRLVLKEGTPEQLEAIKKDELSMNQVYKQIQEKKKEEKNLSAAAKNVTLKTEKEQKNTKKKEITSDEKTSSIKETNSTTKVKTNVSKTEKKVGSSKQQKKTFEDGVRFAITQIKNGISLEELEKNLIA